jgi:hypothetical protein
MCCHSKRIPKFNDAQIHLRAWNVKISQIYLRSGLSYREIRRLHWHELICAGTIPQKTLGLLSSLIFSLAREAIQNLEADNWRCQSPPETRNLCSFLIVHLGFARLRTLNRSNCWKPIRHHRLKRSFFASPTSYWQIGQVRIHFPTTNFV